MARRSESTLRTVRFYEEAGILEPHERSQGGHRLYTERDLQRLRLVSDLRAVGFSLEQIRSLLTIRPEHSRGADAAAEMAEALGEHLAALRSKAKLLARIERDLRRAQTLLLACRACDDDEPGTAPCESCLAEAARGRLPASLRVLFLDASPPDHSLERMVGRRG